MNETREKILDLGGQLSKNKLKSRPYNYIAVFFLFILAVGAISTYIHFINKSLDYHTLFTINVKLLFMTVLMILGLLIRFFKWHIFLRSHKYRLKIRRSLTIFFSSLGINLLFPFLIGEIITKHYFLKREGYSNFERNISFIILERALDLVAIISFRNVCMSFCTNQALADPSSFFHGRISIIGFSALLIVLAGLLCAVNVRALFRIALCAGVGVIGWLIIYLIYFVLPAGVSGYLSFVDFGYYFSNYLLLYPLTPMGIFAAANYQYIILEKIITDPNLLWVTAINIRIVSILPCFLIGLGAVATIIGEKRQHAAFHFDMIADEYSEMIPEHIRERLIDRKCKLIADYLVSSPADQHKKTGLDLGGGKGWYASRIIDLTGAAVILVERSLNQVKDAHSRDPRIKTVLADIQHLPFKKDSIDFSFSINVFHHLENEVAQLKAFESLSSALRNGGHFYLHEINTNNMFFKIYMNYIFPLIKTIDEGIECWIMPDRNRFGNFISHTIVYFTFMPDFISSSLMKLLSPVEQKLELSRYKKYSAHYFRMFVNIKE